MNSTPATGILYCEEEIYDNLRKASILHYQVDGVEEWAVIPDGWCTEFDLAFTEMALALNYIEREGLKLSGIYKALTYQDEEQQLHMWEHLAVDKDEFFDGE